MIYFGLIFLEIGCLFILSRSVSRLLSRFMSINFLSFLFLPGVIVHELSHLLMAVILFVPVGDMEFVPKIGSSGLKLGSIKIGKTDPIRRSLVGFAPVLVGLMIVIGIVYFFSSNIAFFNKDIYIFALVFLGAVYLLFAISNTMFASSKDMEGTIEIIITLIIIFAIAYILGFRLSLSFIDKILTKEVLEIIKQSSIFLLAPIIIDLLILGTVKLFTSIRSRRF